MINFLKYRFVYFAISTVVIGIGLFSIFRWGYIFSVEFVGGTQLGYTVERTIDAGQVRRFVQSQNIEVIDAVVHKNILAIRTKALDEKQQAALHTKLQQKFKQKFDIQTTETVGPTLGAETMKKTAIAAVLAILGILLYTTFAFKSANFAMSAVLAMLHDLLVLLGMYSLLSHFMRAEFDTLFVTAVLTTLSFSVHDTIVIFDKIREYRREYGTGNLVHYANRALTETMVRSVNNSMTIVFMLLALILLGGETIRFFAVALLIGTVTGTYSSPFVATPILVVLEKMKKK